MRAPSWLGPDAPAARLAPRSRRARTSVDRPGRSHVGGVRCARSRTAARPCPRCPRNGSRPARNAVDALLVGGVEDRRGGAAGAPGLPWPGRRRGTPRRPAGRTPRSWPCVQSHGAAPRRDAVRPAQAERDRQPHVRRAGLGERRAVDELDHRVDHRLRVDDDLDPVERDVEEQVRLDDLQALVDQGGGVDRDDRAHVPGRVRQRLLGRDVAQLARGVRPRNGPPLAVRTSRRTSARRCRRAGTGQSASARSRPARSGRARRVPSPAGRRRSATPCWPGRACGRPAARPGWGAARSSR